MRQTLDVAQNMVAAKPVILDKIGRVRDFINVIKGIGDAVSDVRA